MKFASMIKSIAGAALLTGSVNAMASGSHSGWYHDSNTGTFVNANVPSHSGNPGKAVKSSKGSEFAKGVSQNINTGTLMNTNIPAYEKQPGTGADKRITLNSFGGGVYQDKTTGTYIRID